MGEIEHLVFSAGEPLTMVGLADLTAAAITEFIGTRFVGQLQAVREFAPKITPGGSITLTSGTAAEKPGLGVLPTADLRCDQRHDPSTGGRTRAVAGQRRRPRAHRDCHCGRRSVRPIATPCTSSSRAICPPAGSVSRPTPLLAYAYLMEQEFGTGVVLTVDGGTTLV